MIHEVIEFGFIKLRKNFYQEACLPKLPVTVSILDDVLIECKSHMHSNISGLRLYVPFYKLLRSN